MASHSDPPDPPHTSSGSTAAFRPIIVPGGTPVGGIHTGPRITSIPNFDGYGNLPPALAPGTAGFGPSGLAVTLAEIRQRFVAEVPTSTQRAEVWGGWMSHRAAFEALRVPYVTLVGGSFVTSKHDPGDVDLCYLVQDGDVNALDASSQAEITRLLAGPRCKAQYHCDAYSVIVYPLSQPRFFQMVQRIAYWSNVFGVDRKGRAKTFLIVSEAGTV
jgi:hypothetical protein